MNANGGAMNGYPGQRAPGGTSTLGYGGASPSGALGTSGGAHGSYGGAYTGVPQVSLGGAGAGQPPPSQAFCYGEEQLAQACSAVGCGHVEAGSMSFVGHGQGDYITQTTYKYVGPGRGSLSMVGRSSVYYGRICCCLLMIPVLLFMVYLLMPSTTTTTIPPEVLQAALPEVLTVAPTTTTMTTTTTTMPPPKIGECTFWGDPHLRTFDGGRPSFYGEGEFYIVKSDTVIIQGRYMGTRYTDGLAATNKVAVGGPFLKGHTIVVGCLECGDILVDGNPVLQHFPSRVHIPGVATIDYDDQGKVVDQATLDRKMRIVHMTLPNNVQFTVFRWANYVDLRLIMERQPNQDGSCGNFNDNPDDDSTQAVFNRVGARIPEGEMLFGHRAEIGLTEVETKLLALCPRDVFSKARRACAEDLRRVPGSGDATLEKSCMLDYCFGANEHTLRMAKKMGLEDKVP